MGHLEEITALASHLGKVQQRCSALIGQQQREIEQLKQQILLLETALRSHQDRTIDMPPNLGEFLTFTQNRSAQST